MGKYKARACCLLLSVISLVMASAVWSKQAIAAISSNLWIDYTASISSNINIFECQDPCLWKTGINGSWVQDFEFAREHGQYPKPWVIQEGPFQRRTAGAFQPSKDAPFPWRTSWKWVDHEIDCQVDLLTLDRFCKVLQELKVQRILYFGDSLTEAMYKSLANKIGADHFRLSPGNKRNASMICPNDAVYGSGIVDGAKDRIVPVFHKKLLFEKAPPNKTRKTIEFDHEVRHFFTQSKDRVLAIFNMGAHYHNLDRYQKNLTVLLDLLAFEIKRPQDLYFFRSTSPGHEGCKPRTRRFNWKVGTRIVPLAKFEDYKVTVGHQYDWDKFEGYNHYTKEVLLELNQKVLNNPIFHYLDIFNMTALRHDAHAAPSDCLHFQAPGPVDWWNHLLFTYLRRLSKHEQEQRSESTTATFTNCRRSIS